MYSQGDKIKCNDCPKCRKSTLTVKLKSIKILADNKEYKDDFLVGVCDDCALSVYLFVSNKTYVLNRSDKTMYSVGLL